MWIGERRLTHHDVIVLPILYFVGFHVWNRVSVLIMQLSTNYFCIHHASFLVEVARRMHRRVVAHVAWLELVIDFQLSFVECYL